MFNLHILNVDRAGPYLLPQFEKIAFSKTQADKLAKLGITYNQDAGFPLD